MLTLGIVPDPKGREAHFQDFAYVLVLKGVGPSEELLVQKEKKYSLGTFSSGRRLHTIPYHTSCLSTKLTLPRLGGVKMTRNLNFFKINLIQLLLSV